MVKMTRISKNAGNLLRRIVDGLPIAQLKDHKTHLESDGFLLRTVSDIEAAIELAECGFLIKTPDFSDPRPVYLSKSGWDRFQIAEWSEIQRVVDIERSGPEFGSW